jgi:enterobactin synthetase component D
MFVARNTPNIFGDPVSTVSVAFAASDFSEAMAAGLGIPVPASLHRAVRKRKAEYVAGRFCARQAMRSVSANCNAPLASLPGRGPAWPAGIVGSITHTAGFASASVCLAQLARGVGIDSERIMSDPAMQTVRDSILSTRDSFPAGMALEDTVWTTLVFSAKESVFKCLYPLVNKMFWFDTVRIDIPDTDPSAFRATLLVDLNPELRTGMTVEGHYQIEPPYVHTGVLLAA